jgi:hypothetical protein
MEDYAFLSTLLYTGGRAQFYGLRAKEIDFRRSEISTIVKPGRRITIPLHPSLAKLLKEHLATRGYRSWYLFRYGRNPDTRKGYECNKVNAWRICKRIQRAARLDESVHPHRFRKTLATLGRKLGMDPQYVQAILGHETLEATLDNYTQVDIDDVKREYAKLDLLGDQLSNREENLIDSISRLERLAPSGKEHAWKMHLEGLLSLLEAAPANSAGEQSDPKHLWKPKKYYASSRQNSRRIVTKLSV